MLAAEEKIEHGNRADAGEDGDAADSGDEEDKEAALANQKETLACLRDYIPAKGLHVGIKLYRIPKKKMLYRFPRPSITFVGSPALAPMQKLRHVQHLCCECVRTHTIEAVAQGELRICTSEFL